MTEISLIIPILNEESSIKLLISGIQSQTRMPNEVIFVDGGSTDKTIEMIDQAVLKNPIFKIIKTSKSSPGKGRNIGIENARNEWIALTDAGIEIDKDWLKNLVSEQENNSEADLIYGNFSPITNTFFEKCAALSYVMPLRNNAIRGKSVASLLLRKKVWEKVNGFPDLRASEDLMFMEAVEKAGFKICFAPKAMVYWQLRPNLYTTIKKFILYSKYNVWAGRTWDWHYGVAKQYLLALLFISLALMSSWWWAFMVIVQIIARTVKRIFNHRREFGIMPLLNPIYFFTVMFIIFMIDLATFIGWGQAIFSKNEVSEKIRNR